ncbi:class GN sortase [Thalassotalea atypica]|uniref:class GN sortase n=1 Tax=Thalassotalea atypica TaxID=2054316 RepID=UPI002572C554|nr:class GN sortase [Thalassotalea atypica]
MLAKKYSALLLMVLGMVVAVHGAWLPTKAWLSEQLIAYSWHHSSTHKESISPWPWADTQAIAQMHVPRLNKKLVLLLGVDGTSLAFSAGVMHRYSTLNQSSPFIVAGHNDSHFSFLEDIQMKDIISMTDKHGTNQLYQVEDILIINDDTNDLVIDESEASLVLITCYPFDALNVGGSLRYVIKAKLLND